MLCSTCDDIIIKPSGSHQRALIRLYSNVWNLKALSPECNFCSLVYSQVGKLATLDLFAYCRRLWGENLYQKALDLAPIEIYFVDNPRGSNITWKCEVHISNLEGYNSGPTHGLATGCFGGIFVDAGKLYTLLFYF